MTEAAQAPIEIDAKDGGLVASVDAAVFDRRAVLTAAFGFVDRAFVSLRKDAGTIAVVLAPKTEAPLAPELGAELVDALWDARLAGELWKSGHAFVERVELLALGTPEPELPAPELPPLTEAELAAFEDPLGIAQSWEERYLTKKDPPKDG